MQFTSTSQAKASHDVWARYQMDAGWTFGPQYDLLRRTNNRLVPYRHLHKREKLEQQNTVVQLLKGMVWLGYTFTLDTLLRDDPDDKNSIAKLQIMTSEPTRHIRALSSTSGGLLDDETDDSESVVPQPSCRVIASLESEEFKGGRNESEGVGPLKRAPTPKSWLSAKVGPGIHHRQSSGGSHSLSAAATSVQQNFEDGSYEGEFGPRSDDHKRKNRVHDDDLDRIIVRSDFEKEHRATNSAVEQALTSLKEELAHIRANQEVISKRLSSEDLNQQFHTLSKSMTAIASDDKKKPGEDRKYQEKLGSVAATSASVAIHGSDQEVTNL